MACRAICRFGYRRGFWSICIGLHYRCFFAVTYQKRLVLFSSTQQLIYVFLLLFISQLIMLVIKTFAGAQFMGWTYFIPSITGVLLWFMAGLFGLDVGGRNRGN